MVVHFAIHMYAIGAQKDRLTERVHAMLKINVNFRINVLFLFFFYIL